MRPGPPLLATLSAAALCLTAVGARAQTVEQGPLVLGAPVPSDAPPMARVIPPMLSERMCPRASAVTRGGVNYWFTAVSWEDEAPICGIYVWDLSFESPEGIRVGTGRDVLLEYGPAEGTAFGVYEAFALPSQWFAAVPLPGPDDAGDPPGEPSVEFLFREVVEPSR